MSRNYTSSPPSATMAYSGTALLCFFVRIGFDTQTILRKLDYSNEGFCFYIWEGQSLEITVMRSSSRNLLARRADPQCSVERSL
jgi:FtsH-binding integral membrane protein